MRYLMDLSNIHQEKIKELIAKREYKSVSSFIEAAIENQLHLEVLSPGTIQSDAKSTEIQELAMSKNDTEKINFLSRDVESISTVKAPEDSKINFPPKREGSDENLWVWGQINKIFPLKVAVRVLANMLKDAKAEEIRLDIFKDKAADIARSLGLMLCEIEKKDGRKREDKVSLGLPVGDEDFKAKARYKNHFLACYRNKDGILDGALAKFKFINITKGSGQKKETIGITKKGLEFALLENTILDNQKYTETFLEQEKEFYIAHAASEVKGEYGAIIWMLNTIKEGVNKRENINAELNNRYPEWTEKITNTQRSGLVARMFELGLIEKIKNGIKVIYNNSKYGRDLLTKERKDRRTT